VEAVSYERGTPVDPGPKKQQTNPEEHHGQGRRERPHGAGASLDPKSGTETRKQTNLPELRRNTVHISARNPEHSEGAPPVTLDPKTEKRNPNSGIKIKAAGNVFMYVSVHVCICVYIYYLMTQRMMQVLTPKP